MTSSRAAAARRTMRRRALRLLAKAGADCMACWRNRLFIVRRGRVAVYRRDVLGMHRRIDDFPLPGAGRPGGGRGAPTPRAAGKDPA